MKATGKRSNEEGRNKLTEAKPQQPGRRLDTSLESVGAEFLVLGNLLIEGVQASKAYTNYPGYDIIATNPEKNGVCRIQVKSRWATDYNRSFPIRNFDCDFVVLVALNRGYRGRRKAVSPTTGRKAPEFYVFPVEIVKAAQKPKSKLGIVPLRNIEDPAKYLENWGLVRNSLEYDDVQT